MGNFCWTKTNYLFEKMSQFNLDAFQTLFKESPDQIVELAKTAEATERYEDMCMGMKELVKMSNNKKQPLTVEERNLLSVAYKNVIGTRRASWRTLNAEFSDDKTESHQKKLVEAYKSHVENELKDTCDEVIVLLESLIPMVPEDETEPKVFYLKMAGDYYRYLAESVGGEATGQKAASYYEKAAVAAKNLSETHPIRLGLALNYSVCYYEILKQPAKAYELAKNAFDDAISKLDKLEEADYKDSTLIMQLLRDNLTLWTADNQDDGDEVQVQDVSDDETH